MTWEVFHDPVVAADGHTYERAAIERWFEASLTSPMTGRRLEHAHLSDNIALRSSIEQYVDRMPKPNADVDCRRPMPNQCQ